MKDKTSDRQKLSDIEKEDVVAKTVNNEAVKQTAKLSTPDQLAVTEEQIDGELAAEVNNPNSPMTPEEAMQVKENLATGKKRGGLLTQQFTEAMKFLMPQMVGAAAGALAGGGARGAMEGANIAGQAATAYRGEVLDNKRLQLQANQDRNMQRFQLERANRLQKSEVMYDSRTNTPVSYDPQSGQWVKVNVKGQKEPVPMQYIGNLRRDTQVRLQDQGDQRIDISKVNARLRELGLFDKMGEDSESKKREMLKSIESNKVYQDAEKSLSTVNRLKSLVDQAEQDGGVSLSALGTSMARFMGEVGVLTDQDVIRYIQNPSIPGRIRDTFFRLKSGQTSGLTADSIRKVINTIEKYHVENQDLVVDKISGRRARATKDFTEQEAKEIVKGPSKKEPKRQSKSQQMVDWIKKNPEDPRAIRMKKLLGI